MEPSVLTGVASVTMSCIPTVAGPIAVRLIGTRLTVAVDVPTVTVHVYTCPGALVAGSAAAVTWTVVADEVVQVSGADAAAEADGADGPDEAVAGELERSAARAQGRGGVAAGSSPAAIRSVQLAYMLKARLRPTCEKRLLIPPPAWPD